MQQRELLPDTLGWLAGNRMCLGSRGETTFPEECTPAPQGTIFADYQLVNAPSFLRSKGGQSVGTTH